MSVTFDDVRHIAGLARVGVPEDRLPVLARELSGILEHMAVLQRVDTTGVHAEVELATTPLRPDHGPPIPLHHPLSAFAPEMRDGFFVVPRLASHGGSGAPGGSDGERADDGDDVDDVRGAP